VLPLCSGRATTSGSPARRPTISRPETNGCAEKFIQTLKEQVLWIERFATFEELRAAVRRFAANHNCEWVLERHD
jgi:putative transposase